MRTKCSILALIMLMGIASLVRGEPPEITCSGALNMDFMIDNRKVQLVDGRTRMPAAPGSAATMTTEIYGRPVCDDLNGDGREDAALLLLHKPGGSGVFYYAGVAVAANGIYRGSNLILLGDRIILGEVRIRDHVIIIEYTDRRPDQPVAAAPSVTKTIRLKMVAGRLEAIGKPLSAS